MARRSWYTVVLLMAFFLSFPMGAFAAPAGHPASARSNYGNWLGPKWIEVNLSEQWLTAYEGDTPIFGTAVSTGIEGMETPTGDYAIEYMLEWQTMWGDDYYLEDVPYVMYFADYLAIHGTYWHDNFGTPMSHGCVNLPVWAAERLYGWATYGTGVWIHY